MSKRLAYDHYDECIALYTCRLCGHCSHADHTECNS